LVAGAILAGVYNNFTYKPKEEEVIAIESTMAGPQWPQWGINSYPYSVYFEGCVSPSDFDFRQFFDGANIELVFDNGETVRGSFEGFAQDDKNVAIITNSDKETHVPLSRLSHLVSVNFIEGFVHPKSKIARLKPDDEIVFPSDVVIPEDSQKPRVFKGTVLSSNGENVTIQVYVGNKKYQNFTVNQEDLLKRTGAMNVNPNCRFGIDRKAPKTQIQTKTQSKSVQVDLRHSSRKAYVRRVRESGKIAEQANLRRLRTHA